MMSRCPGDPVAIQAMHTPKTFPEWFEYRDGLRTVALLKQDGAMNPLLARTALEPLALLAAAIHAASGMLSESELRHAELFLAMHRWRSRGETGQVAGED